MLNDFTVYDGAAHQSTSRVIAVVPPQMRPGVSVRVDTTCCDSDQPARHLRSVIALTGNRSALYWICGFEIQSLYPPANDWIICLATRIAIATESPGPKGIWTEILSLVVLLRINDTAKMPSNVSVGARSINVGN